jgi:3-phosphoshikimate 1-carboxyvinyltransferase
MRGPIRFNDIAVDGSLSSQFLSGLLMVYPLAGKDHVIEVQNLKSRQYIDLTLQVLNDFGISIVNESYERFVISGGQRYQSCTADVEGDWSGAAFMLVAGATAGSVTVTNLDSRSLQPDRVIIDVLKKAGAEVVDEPGRITATKKELVSFSFDATGCPDLFPPLVTLAAQCTGTSVISGVERLIYKESNRALALQQEFGKLNAGLISIEGNEMHVMGGLRLNPAEAHSHHDHRIAMALAVAALNIEGGIKIEGSEAVDKSYPGFFEELENVTKKK